MDPLNILGSGLNSNGQLRPIINIVVYIVMGLVLYLSDTSFTPEAGC